MCNVNHICMKCMMAPIQGVAAGCVPPSDGSQFIFRAQQVCNNGLFLGAMQKRLFLTPFRVGESGTDVAFFIPQGLTLNTLSNPGSSLQRMRRRRGCEESAIKWLQQSVATGDGNSQTPCKL